MMNKTNCQNFKFKKLNKIRIKQINKIKIFLSHIKLKKWTVIKKIKARQKVWAIISLLLKINLLNK